MPLHEFWSNVQAAAWMGSFKAFVDSPKVDAARIERTLRSNDLWLSPSAVEGFDSGDFAFLSEAERSALIESVDRFLQVAEDVPNDGPAVDTRVERALPAFARIVEILNPGKYADLDSFVLGKQIERVVQAKLPDWVHDLRFESGPDSIGEPGLWIWAELDDSATEDDVFSQNNRLIVGLLFKASRRVSQDWWPYVSIRSVSEQRAISK